MTISPSGSRLRSTNSSPGGGPSAPRRRRPVGGQGGEPGPVVGGGHPDRVVLERILVQSQSASLAAALDQGVHQGVTIFGVDAGMSPMT